jgi:hypothetical protein
VGRRAAEAAQEAAAATAIQTFRWGPSLRPMPVLYLILSPMPVF